MNKESISFTFTEQEPYEKGFKDYFDKHIAPYIPETEKYRLKKKSEHNIRSGEEYLVKGTLYTFIALPTLLIKGLNSLFDIVMFPINLITTSYEKHSKIPKEEYETNLKEKIISKCFQFFGRFEIQNEDAFSQETIHKAILFPDWDEGIQGLSISGIYKNVLLMINEITLQKVPIIPTEMPKTVFDGIIITCQFERPFLGKTIVTNDKGALGNIIESWGKKNLTQSSFEDPLFEKLYEIYTTDPIEARYLLPPDFMEQILDLSRAFGNNIVELSFFDNILVLKISGKERFLGSAKLHKSLYEEETFHLTLSEVKNLLGIIETLRLKPRTLRRKAG